MLGPGCRLDDLPFEPRALGIYPLEEIQEILLLPHIPVVPGSAPNMEMNTSGWTQMNPASPTVRPEAYPPGLDPEAELRSRHLPPRLASVIMPT